MVTRDGPPVPPQIDHLRPWLYPRAARLGTFPCDSPPHFDHSQMSAGSAWAPPVVPQGTESPMPPLDLPADKTPQRLFIDS